MGLSEDLERIAVQERELVLPRLDTQVAWELGLRLKTLAEERGLALVVDIRRFGQPLFYAALEGTTPDNAEWVRRKSNVVARFHRSSYAVSELEVEEHDAAGAAWAAGVRLCCRRGIVSADRDRHGNCGQRDRLRTAAARRSRTGCGSAVRDAGARLHNAEAGGGVGLQTNGGRGLGRPALQAVFSIAAIKKPSV